MTATLVTLLLVSWTCVHVYAGATNAFLGARLKRQREYASFALTSAGLAVYCGATVLLFLAEDGREAAQSASLRQIGSFIALAGAVRFFYDLAGVEPETMSRVQAAGLRFAYIVAGVGTALALSGALFDADIPIAHRPIFVPGPHPPHEVQMTAIGRLCVIGGSCASTWCILAARDMPHPHPDGRLLALLGILASPTWLIDVTAMILGRPSFYLLEHVSLVASVWINYLLMRRFVSASDQLIARTRELDASVRHLETVEAELVRKEQLAAVGELSAVIAQEVRNPLTMLKRATSRLQRMPEDAGTRATLLDVLDVETDRLNRLVRDLLTYARPITPQPAPMDVRLLLDECVEAARKSVGTPDSLSVGYELEDVPDRVGADRDLLARAITHLVENAMQAMPQGGRRTLAARVGDAEIQGRRTPQLVLEFHDTGEGIDTEIRTRALDPFFTTRSSGTGLGLAIVARVVTAHGGQMTLARNARGGATVRFELPVERLDPDPARDEGAALLGALDRPNDA